MGGERRRGRRGRGGRKGRGPKGWFTPPVFEILKNTLDLR